MEERTKKSLQSFCIVNEQDIRDAFIRDQLVQIAEIVPGINDDDSLKVRDQERDKAVRIRVLDDQDPPV